MSRISGESCGGLGNHIVVWGLVYAQGSSGKLADARGISGALKFRGAYDISEGFCQAPCFPRQSPGRLARGTPGFGPGFGPECGPGFDPGKIPMPQD